MAKTKKVRYNGGTDTYYCCSTPINLIVGKVYEVVSEIDRDFQTDYVLRGIEGEFNSVWFDTVYSDAKVYMAISNKIPVVGERYSCYKMDIVDGRPKFTGRYTTTVQEIIHLGNSVYNVRTRNSIYIVNVG